MPDELRRANGRLSEADAEVLYQLAVTDSLTGCYNRRFFEDVIGHELDRHRRYGIPVSLLFLDVNNFKAVNDSLGHETGDRVLQQVAGFLKEHLRKSDYVFRWGGDEFVILMCCTLDHAKRRGVGLKAAFRAAREVSRLPAGIGLSVGCSEVGPSITDIGPALREADERMYEDKRAEREVSRDE